MTQNYSLCRDALSYYNVSSDSFNEVEFDNSAWWSEYQRVCLLDLSSPLPTVPFNTTIILSTESSTDMATTTISGTTAQSMATSAIASTSATSTSTSNVSSNGLCGASYGYTCLGSEFGNCCSIYGYW